MPIYEYVCDDCGKRYERIVMNKSTRVSCPNCQSAKKTLQLSVFAAPANGSKASPQASNAPPLGGCGCTPGGCGCH